MRQTIFPAANGGVLLHKISSEGAEDNSPGRHSLLRNHWLNCESSMNRSQEAAKRRNSLAQRVRGCYETQI